MSGCLIELPYPDHTGNHSVRHSAHGHYVPKEALTYRLVVAERLRGRQASCWPHQHSVADRATDGARLGLRQPHEGRGRRADAGRLLG